MSIYIPRTSSNCCSKVSRPLRWISDWNVLCDNPSVLSVSTKCPTCGEYRVSTRLLLQIADTIRHVHSGHFRRVTWSLQVCLMVTSGVSHGHFRCVTWSYLATTLNYVYVDRISFLSENKVALDHLWFITEQWRLLMPVSQSTDCISGVVRTPWQPALPPGHVLMSTSGRDFTFTLKR